MVAKLHHIINKTRGSELDFSFFEQFELDAGQEVSAQLVLEERIWYPYTLDHATQALIFLDMPAGVDLSQEAFVFPRQFMEARRVLCVPYSEIMALAAQVTIPENPIFIFSIGRCGSTLLNQILNQVTGVYSYSEPDVPTILSLFHQAHQMSDALIGDIVEAATKLQMYAAAPDDAKQVAHKFRGQVTSLMPYFAERFPNAKMIFMYRDPLKWARSTYRFLMMFFDDDTLSLDEIRHLFRMYPPQSLALLGQYLDVSRERFYRVEQIALLLMIQLELYVASAAKDTIFALHYEDMLAEPERIIADLLNFCGIPQTEVAQALRGLAQDSQEGTMAARDVSKRDFDAEAQSLFLQVLKQHPVFGAEDFRL